MTTKQKTEATPRPWILNSREYHDGFRIEAMEGKASLGTIWGLNNEANVHLIVKAVNNHDKLVEALKEALKEFNEMGYEPKKAKQMLEQALKSCEKGEYENN